MKALRFSSSLPQYALLKALGSRSKRLFYKGPLATVRLADVTEPELPAPDWVKIKTSVCGFCGSDFNLVFLRESLTASPFISYPCTLGHELSGEVVEVGSGVRGVGVGDLVTVAPHLGCSARGIEPPCRSCRMGRPANCENFAEGNLAPGMLIGLCRDVGGGFAPYLVAHEDQVFRLPAGVSHREGAMIEPLAVTVQAVLDNKPDKHDQVLVIGAGVIGNLIVQSLRALAADCTVAVAEPSPFHANLAARAGADHVFSDGDILRHATELTGARAYKPVMGKTVLMGGFSKIFDTVASAGTLDASLRALAAGGVLSMVGIGKGVMTDLTPLWLKLQTIKGVYCYGYHDVGGGRKHTFELAIDLVKHKKVDLEPMITHTFRLEDYKRMIEVNLNKGKHAAVKTVVSFA